MKMEDLKKLVEKADKILKEEIEKIELLKTTCEAGLIKKPEYRNFWNPTALCPECKKNLIKKTSLLSPYFRAIYFYCPNCEYEYAS